MPTTRNCVPVCKSSTWVGCSCPVPYTQNRVFVGLRNDEKYSNSLRRPKYGESPQYVEDDDDSSVKYQIDDDYRLGVRREGVLPGWLPNGYWENRVPNVLLNRFGLGFDQVRLGIGWAQRRDIWFFRVVANMNTLLTAD